VASLRSTGLLVGALLFSAVTCSCGGDAPPPAAAKREAATSWADVFDGTPDFYAVLRPHAMKRDGIYGSFFKSLLRAAQARGIARGDTMVQVVEGSEEIIIGLNRGLDAAVVLRAVPASVDPQKVTDAEGRSLFRLASDPRGKVTEYDLVDRRHTDAGGLFVLPDRTWVGVLGEARGRARRAFSAPLNRPVPQVDADALAVIRVGGSLVHVIDKHPLFGPLAQKATSATFALKPNKGGVVIALAYEEASTVAWAEMHAKRVVEELTRGRDDRAWLKDAKVAYEGNTLFVRMAVPPRLLEELPSAASGADLGL
jgi:hypothetical protein